MTILIYLFVISLAVYVLFGLLMLTGLLTAKPCGRNTSKPFVSVIIAARNEAAHIATCLESVLNQTYENEQYEVIVVNDRSSDNTGVIAESYISTYNNLKVITITDLPLKVSPKKWAIQKGIENSRGEILLFTDADCQVKPTWMESMVGCFMPDTGMVIGFSAIRAVSFFEKLQAFDFLSLMAAAFGACTMGLKWSASGQNLGYRRKAFDQAGGFSSVINRISGDDALMVQLIRKLKTWRIVFNPDPRSFNETEPQNNLKSLIHQRSRWASNATIMIKLNPVLFFYLFAVFIFYSGLVAGMVCSLLYSVCLWPLVFGFIHKMIIDLLITVKASSIFHQPFSPAVFIIWFLFQLPYTLLVGLRGSLQIFKWKQ